MAKSGPTKEDTGEVDGFDIATLATDKTLEKEGVWCKMGNKGCELLIARLGNPLYKKWIRQQGRAQKLALSLGGTDLEEANLLVIEAVSHTVLLDWKKLYLNKKLFPYSHENALKMMTEYPDFYDLVIGLAQDREQFRGEKDAAESKNSSSVSSSR